VTHPGGKLNVGLESELAETRDKDEIIQDGMAHLSNFRTIGAGSTATGGNGSAIDCQKYPRSGYFRFCQISDNKLIVIK
jgi:hypothetical protein